MSTAIVTAAVALLKAIAIVRAAGDNAHRSGQADQAVYSDAFYDACEAVGIKAWDFFDDYCPVSDEALRNSDVLAAYRTVVQAVGAADNGDLRERLRATAIDYERVMVCYNGDSIAHRQTVSKGLI